MMLSCMRANSRFSFTQLFAVSSLLLFTIASHGNDSVLGAESDQAGAAEIKALIRQAIAARDKAATSIPRARGKGSYRVTVIDKAMNVTYKERASFQMARSDPRQFFQFRYEEGAGHEDRDVYARVVVSDGETIVYESRFCQRIRPTGAEALAYKDFEPGSLQPCVWISGNLARYYSFGDRLLMEKDAKLSLRDEDGVQVVTVTEGGAAMEFWIDPRKDFHIVRYRLVLSPDTTPLVVTDVFREWKRQDELWFVHRCLVRDKSRKGKEIVQTAETELVFDAFEPNVDIPRDVFTIHALGLPDNSRIRSGESGRPITEYSRDTKFDRSAVEKVVGKLPTALPAR